MYRGAHDPKTHNKQDPILGRDFLPSAHFDPFTNSQRWVGNQNCTASIRSRIQLKWVSSYSDIRAYQQKHVNVTERQYVKLPKQEHFPLSQNQRCIEILQCAASSQSIASYCPYCHICAHFPVHIHFPKFLSFKVSKQFGPIKF